MTFKLLQNVDWVDFITVLCISAFGLFILASVEFSYVPQQLFFIVIASIIMLLFSRVDGMLLVWFAPISYILSLIFLALSYFGPSIRGATRWVVVGGAQIQPSEMVKPFILLSLSWFMAKYPPRTVKNVSLQFFLFFIPFFLVFKQPDLGTSIVYFALWLGMMVASGFSLKYVVFFSLIGGLLVPFLWGHLHDYQRTRIEVFLNPGVDPQGAGYNALQAMIAVGSGQLVGKGLGLGTQSQLRFLPEFHTDFIFATLVEQMGFVGGFILLVGYAILLFRILKPLLVGEVVDLFPFVFCVGLFTMILSQIAINAGMNMGIIPVTGITLPLISYGGSSLLSIAICFGILWIIRKVHWTAQ